MAILRCFEDEDDDLGISEIAKRTGLRVSTAHRIVRALCGGGLMDQDRRSDRYRLGRTLVLLGQRAASQLGLESARPVLERLAHATGESASLGTRHGDELVVVLVASSAQRLRFDHEQGGRIGLHASAMGKAVLAFATRDVARAVPEGIVLERYTAHTITDRDELVADLALTRERGYAVNDQGRFDGVLGIGAPLLGRDGLAHAAVGVQGPTSRLTPDVVLEVATEVRKAADELADLPVLDRL
jgi:IclR family acetate operon transcriptional repressor